MEMFFYGGKKDIVVSMPCELKETGLFDLRTEKRT